MGAGGRSWRGPLQALATAFAFRIASDIALRFAGSSGASFLFPPAAVILAASAGLGGWGVLGVALGSLASRWGAAYTWPHVALFTLVHTLTAAVPAVALRRPGGGAGRRLRRAVVVGGPLANLVSAAAGTAILAGLGDLPRAAAPLAHNFGLWWAADTIAALVLGLPLLLFLRPEVIVIEADRAAFMAWLRSPSRVGTAAGLIGVGLAAILWVEALGWGFPHWLVFGILAPIAFAAQRGGLGPALVVNAIASIGYIATLLSATVSEGSQLEEVLAPGYTTLGVCTSFALIGGWLGSRNRRLAGRIRSQQLELERDFDTTVASLAAAVEAKDPTTEGHVQRVAQLAARVGEKLGLSDAELGLLRFGALLHDVGKIGIPEAVLSKPGPLTVEERTAMERHVEIGLRIIGNIERLRDVAPIIRFHQERWDGVRHGVAFPGYFGLAGEDIPLAARVLTGVDAFDAMTHDRPYRCGRPAALALAELEREAGRQFDPRVVRALAEVAREEGWVGAAGSAPAISGAKPTTSG
ncbi:MAG TPA: HD domain-containing phosphohydrolase [Thermoanaerobaculia bacterium]|nr:HD domain-containing phosphohydrolase [Thermoanaerobaculia bacterium]